jgi:hypothetical protein
MWKLSSLRLSSALIACALASLVAARQSAASPVTLVDKPADVSSGSTGFTSMYGDQNMLEHFTFSTAATLSQISWSGLFTTGLTATSQSIADFDILLFGNDAASHATTANGGLLVSGLPSYQPLANLSFSNVAGVSTGLSNPLFGGTVFQWTVNVPALSLAADEYWIDIRSASTEPNTFIWSNSLVSDGYTVSNVLADSFAQCDLATAGPFTPCDPANRAGWAVADGTRGQAFSVTGSEVPEPATLLLMGTGLAGLGLFRQRRQVNGHVDREQLRVR